MDSKRKKLMFDIQQQKLEQCFHFGGGEICRSSAIKAHSIQNRGVLEQLAEDGHVVMIEIELNAESGPRLTYKRVGRNKATTFTGLCATHDNNLFQPIDDEGIDLGSEQHKFLVAFRTLLRELTAKATVSKRLAYAHSEATKLGGISEHQLLEAEHRSMEAAAECIGLLEHIGNFWQAFRVSDWTKLSHTEIRLEGKAPGFACSALYAFEHDFSFLENQENYRTCALNVFGDEGDTVAIFSYLTRDSDYWTSHLAELQSLSGVYLEYRLSKLVLANSDNLVLRPSFYSSFSEEKKASISDFYGVNANPEKIDVEDRNLYLF